MSARDVLLRNMFQAMFDRLGPSHWWPGETPFEIAVGAVLTQNTNWKNVEKAIANLRESDLLHAERLYAVPEERLAELIRPAGYFRIKARRLHAFLHFLRDECGFDMESLAERDMDELRPRLLEVKGVGPETADAILLYALNKPSFVVDAYTHRILSRHGLVSDECGYDEMRDMFMDVLPPDIPLYNEYHALIVRVGKEWCRKRKPDCDDCPLADYL